MENEYNNRNSSNNSNSYSLKCDNCLFVRNLKEEMEIREYPLTCNQIGRISMKSESSDLVILPVQLKPRKPNMLGFYIFKVTSDLNKRWIYCRVVEWTAGERDCYMPTVFDS